MPGAEQELQHIIQTVSQPVLLLSHTPGIHRPHTTICMVGPLEPQGWKGQVLPGVPVLSSAPTPADSQKASAAPGWFCEQGCSRPDLWPAVSADIVGKAGAQVTCFSRDQRSIPALRGGERDMEGEQPQQWSCWRTGQLRPSPGARCRMLLA